jgi:hypothetical protein
LSELDLGLTVANELVAIIVGVVSVDRLPMDANTVEEGEGSVVVDGVEDTVDAITLGIHFPLSISIHQIIREKSGVTHDTATKVVNAAG